jgi:hypothetical protein
VYGPFAARGAEGKESTPRVWMGGTDEFVVVGKQEHQGARGCHHSKRANKVHMFVE